MTAAPTFAAGLALAFLAAGLPAQQQEPEVDPTLVLASEFLATLAPAEDDPDVVARRLLETAFRHPSSPAAGQLAQRAEQMLAGLTDPEALHDWLTDHPVQETAHGLLAWRVAPNRSLPAVHARRGVPAAELPSVIACVTGCHR